MSQISRARSPAQKQKRAQALLAATRDLEAVGGFDAVLMADVARRAGVAKGTVFLYYPTKEALGLALLEHEMAAWFADLEASLSGGRAPGTPREMARHLARSVAARPLLGRMLSLQGSVLERNVEADRLRAYKAGVLERMRRCGAALERALPFLAHGDGLRLLLFLQVLVVGLHPMGEPVPAVRAALADADMAPLRIDFPGSLESVLRIHIEGMRALRAGP